MFDLKKFVAFMGVEDKFMQKFYDHAEQKNLNPHFDTFHVVAGEETPSAAEIEIMKRIYESDIKGSTFEKDYETADRDFRKKIAERNKTLLNRISRKPLN
jgi:hypothetical protein